MLEPQFQEILTTEDPMSSWRKKSWDKFRDLGSLQLKQDAFRYVPVQNLVVPKAALRSSFHVQSFSQRPYRIIFVDGFFSEEHSVLPDGVICLPLDEAMNSYGVFLQTRFTKVLNEEMDPFAALNGAFQGQGAFVYIPPKKQFSHPIFVEHFFTNSDMATPRLILYVGKQSNVEISQEWHRKESSFINAYVDVALDEGATVQCKTVERGSEKSHLFQSWRVSSKKMSKFTFRLYSEGAAVSRHSLKVQLLEEGSEALLQGVATLEKSLHHHIHATVEHCAENTRSRQHFKTLLRDTSCSSFEGKIYVHPEAQKTESYQLNNVLLLSDTAQSFAKPNLEVLADDVKASHGATIAQLDAESLFYLRARGLSAAEAQLLLVDSFVKELKECLP